jgi:hypothetical protein
MGRILPRGAALAAAMLAFAPGCGGSEPEGPDPNAWIALGAGDQQYLGLADGDRVQIVLGPQGGHMIALALRAGSVEPGDERDPSDPANPRITFRALRPLDDSTLGIITQQRGLSPADDDIYESYGTWLTFSSAIPTDVYFDTEIRVQVDLVDARGAQPTDEVTVMAITPPVTASVGGDLDVDPGEVIRRANHDAEHAAGDVGDAQQQGVTRDHLTAVETSLERHVAHVAGVGVVE